MPGSSRGRLGWASVTGATSLVDAVSGGGTVVPRPVGAADCGSWSSGGGTVVPRPVEVELWFLVQWGVELWSLVQWGARLWFQVPWG